ncbi:FAD-dependent oxidoreductase [Acidithiobacillus ferrianus]|uniref:Rubredoxin-NAD(+) reductase n=2 Tax=Acidithiobacillus ferrianus TaxID=2678518 RepID=A0A845U7W3_9PROT|nr:rubredoxin-NAD(+) reductase [Acidithiobacillus ferrianus]
MHSKNYERWICEACGFIYDEAQGDPDSGLAPGTCYADIPEGWECPLCGMRKSDLRLLTDSPAGDLRKTEHIKTPDRCECRGGAEYIVIVGAGFAGWSVAEALRRIGSSAPVLLISSCRGDFYSKPSLSGALADGKTAQDLIYEDAFSRAQRLNIQIRTDTPVIQLDPSRKRLITSHGSIAYGKLVLALGAHQRELALRGNAAHNVHAVNDLADYMKLRQKLDSGPKLVTILGSGLIGCEFADDISGAGHAVTMVDPNHWPLSRLLPEEMAIDLQKQLNDKGIVFHLGTILTTLEYSAGRYRAVLQNGVTFETDIVVIAAGLIPNTGLAERTGLKVDKGISVDLQMQSSISDIYALGDCASVEGTVYSYIEPIKHQAETIAENLTGQRSLFSKKPTIIKVKTPTFPLAACQIRKTETRAWTVVERQEHGCRMELTDEHGELAAVAISGFEKLAARELYKYCM